MKQHHAIQVLLVTAMILWNLVELAVLRTTGEEWPAPQAVVGMGLALGQVCLAAAYAALGRLNVALRIGLLVVVTAQSGYLAGLSTHGETNVWFSILLILGVLGIVPLVVMRLAKVRLVHLTDEPAENGSPWQFSLWELLSLMTAVAVLAATLRWFQFPPEDYDEVFLFSLAVVVSLWVCVPSVLMLPSMGAGVIAPSIVIALVGLVIRYTGFPPREDAWELWAMNWFHGGLILGSCVIVRLAGYRLIWGCAAIPPPEPTEIIFKS